MIIKKVIIITLIKTIKILKVIELFIIIVIKKTKLLLEKIDFSAMSETLAGFPLQKTLRKSLGGKKKTSRKP